MEYIKWNSLLDSFFDESTMSVHFKENVHVLRKKGRPWKWESEILEDTPSKSYLHNIIASLYKEIEQKDDSFLEIERKYSKVMQVWPYRIVIVLPPLSDGIEITVVKPVKKLSIEDYNLEPKIIELLKDKAQWILISWSPWEWKTTFAQALIEVYVSQNKIIKTIESPRDLLVPNEVTQYSFSYAPHSEIRDILLLSRPDYTVYDEVRNTEDFVLFKDLRLTWIWLIWVMHATNPIDSIQRFLGTIEMWIIPQVIDTIVFIKAWAIQEIFQLESVVKVPEWMESADLARPVIQVYDFLTNEAKYEIYSYWEQIVVMPLDKVWWWRWAWGTKKSSSISNFGIKYISDYLSKQYTFNILVEQEWENSIKVFVPETHKWKIIWKQWSAITKLEKDLGVSISVRTFEELKPSSIDFKIETIRKNKKETILLKLPTEYSNKDVTFRVQDNVISLTADSFWEIYIKNYDLVKKILKHWIDLVNR